MPHPNWTHACKKTGRTRSDWKPFRCWRCFGQAAFAGWSSGVVEMMGAYQREHGLICMGPHRPLADQVFAGAFTRCDACGGSGYRDDIAHRSWAACAACDGVGRRPTEALEPVTCSVTAGCDDGAGGEGAGLEKCQVCGMNRVYTGAAPRAAFPSRRLRALMHPE